MSDTKKPDFPESRTGLMKKIPKPVVITSIVVLVLVLVLTSWPHGKKTSAVDDPKAQTVKTDAFEQQSPINKPPFSTQESQAANQEQEALDKSSEYGDVKTKEQSAPEESPGGAPVDKGRPSIDNRPRAAYADQGSGVYTPPAPVSSEMTRRLDNSYQQMVQHLKATAQMAVVAVSNEDYAKIVTNGNTIANVEPSLQNLSSDMAGYKNKAKLVIPAGSRIRAITQQEVNSDHPGYFTARVTMPEELRGYTLVCNAKGNTRDRIPVTVEKIVSPEGKEKASPSGEVQMNYAGLEGEIKSHYIKRLLPPIASAFIGAGAGYLYYKAVADGQNASTTTGERINTADGVVGPSYQAGVTGVQDEITRMGGDNPNTVIVPKGTAFDILVTDAVEMAL